LQIKIYTGSASSSAFTTILCCSVKLLDFLNLTFIRCNMFYGVTVNTARRRLFLPAVVVPATTAFPKIYAALLCN